MGMKASTLCGLFGLLVAWLAGPMASAQDAVAGPVIAVAAAAEVAADDARETLFTLDLTAGVQTEIYTLAHPYRVVIDLPGVGFKIDPAAGRTGAGLVNAYRFGAMAEHKARVVIDTTGPVAITRAEMTNLAPTAGPPGGVRLSLSLAAVDVVAFGEGTGVNRQASARPAVKPAVFEDSDLGAKKTGKPVVMIDPGHGGIDPGAIGPQKTTEKMVVLAVARQLKVALEAGGHYDVRLTRYDDVFIPLDRRVELSTAAHADIFLSLHADAIDDGALARTIHGASIYTLSDRASDEQARLMADKENAADLAAGAEQIAVEDAGEIKGILFDLLNRETAAFAHLLSRSLAEAMGKTGGLAREPERAAAFRVLKQAHAPSVLIELGFLSNPTEERQMKEAWWQKQTAGAIAAAVESYFANRAQQSPTAPARAAFGKLPP